MKYSDYLLGINKMVCEDSEVRTNSLEFFPIIEEAIDRALESDDEIFYRAMKATAVIVLYQPFMDGNHRTGLVVFGNIMNEKGYDFDYNSALIDMHNHELNVPIIYTEYDEFSYPEEWGKYLSKRSKKARKRKVA